jgi:hypothetical protein
LNGQVELVRGSDLRSRGSRRIVPVKEEGHTTKVSALD